MNEDNEKILVLNEKINIYVGVILTLRKNYGDERL